jgi:peptidoglycan/LPS O-acetylase OafA/YrhL
LFSGSLLLSLALTTTFSQFSFFLLPARIWEFAAGALLALYLPTHDGHLKQHGTALSTVGLALCIGSIMLLQHDRPFPGAWALPPVAGGVLLLAGLTLNPDGIWGRFFKLGPLVFIGLISYGWYLWHWPLLSVYKLWSLGDDTLIGRVIVCAVALAVAFISFRFVEKPIRERRHWPFDRTTTTLGAGFGMTLVALVLAGGLSVTRYYQR